MKKRWITSLLAVAAACLCVGGFSACFGEEKTTEGLVYEIFQLRTPSGALADAYEARVVGYTGKAKTVTIASMYEGEAVTTIADGAFEKNTTITSVKFPLSIQDIGKRAFAECSNLTSVTKEDGKPLQELGEEAFYECNRLNGCFDSRIVGKRAFYGCENVTGFKSTTDSESGTHYVGEEAFANCITLTDVSLNDATESVAHNAFDGSYNVKYNVKDGLEYLPSANNPYFFLTDAEESLTSAAIDENCKIVAFGAFSDCNRLEELTSPLLQGGYLGYIFGAESATENASCVPQSLKKVKYTGKEIKSYAFSGCNNLTEIEIPNVTSIGSYAFSGCNGLTEIELPSRMMTIGAYAFSGCRNLKKIDTSAAEYLEFIDEYAFSDCESLTELSITARSLGYGILKNCTSLAKLEIPLDARTKKLAYFTCRQLFDAENGVVPASLKEVTLLDCSGTTRIKEYFLGCSNIEKIVIESVTQILDNFFTGCTALKEVHIPSDTAVIEDNSFDRCYSLTKIVVDKDNKIFESIDGNLYYKAGVLKKYAVGKTDTSFTVPDSVTGISANAFAGCTALKNVTLPSSIKRIGESAFENCKNLQYNVYNNVKYLGSVSNQYIALIECVDNDTLSEVTIHPDTRVVAGRAFYYCYQLTEVTIPDGVTAISKNMFDRCEELKSVTIGSGVTEIGDCAFIDCRALESINIPANVKTIGKQAFDGCEKLENVTLSEGLTTIGEAAFQACSSLREIVIPDSVTTLGREAFYKCSGLGRVVVGNGVTGLHGYVFGNCTSLTEVVLGDGITAIGDYAFWNCSSLQRIVIPAGITTMQKAFIGCHTDLIIYCRDKGPSGYGWYDTWNCKTTDGNEYYEVVWGYTGD